MAEKSYVWDGVAVGDATEAPYSATEWAAQRNLLHGIGASFPNYGVLSGTGGGTYEPLAVIATNPASTNVEVRSGAAMVNGKLYESTSTVTLAVSANASGNARIDTVVLRVDYTLQTVRAVILPGTPAASPARPTLTQNASTWEIPLADIAVANGFSTIVQTNITQRRRYANSAAYGWQPYAFPSKFVVNGDYNTASLSVFASNGSSLAIPFTLSANLLLQTVAFWQRNAGAGNYGWGWDMYFQDTNDGETSENTLRRVAQSNGDATGANPLSASLYTLSASGGVVPLSPGQYWLVVQRRSGTISLQMGAITATTTSFVNGCKSKVTSNPNGDTLDFATGWTNQTSVPGVVLSGRVFGQTTAY